MSVDSTLVEDLQHISGCFNHKSAQILHVNASIFILEIKSAAVFLGQKVTNLLVVDLEVGAADKILAVLLAFNLFENVLEGSWHDTLELGVLDQTTDRKCLASARLTVGEDGSVITLNDV